MAYTGGNSGYVRRLGRVPSTTPVGPTTPVAGYSVWFDASAAGTLWQDVAKTIPAADGDPVKVWESRGGSAGSYEAKQPNGLVFPTYNAVTPASVLSRSTRDWVFSKPTGGVRTDGVISANGAAFVIFAVVKWDSADDKSAVGLSPGNGFFIEQRNQPGNIEMAMYNPAGGLFGLDGDFSGSIVIVTSMLSSGTGYIGVNDTRTASMASGAVSNFADATLEIMGSLGTRFLNGELFEVVFYPTVLSEADRQLTEQYLANKYGITLPY